MSHPAFTVALLSSLALLPATLAAQTEDAAGSAHRQAIQHYARGEYNRAAEAFKAAYLAEPKPELLYAIAQALRLAGRCSEALEYYRQYLRTAPGPKQVVSTRENMKRCEAAATSKEPTQVPSAGLATPTTRRSAPRSAPQRPAPWYRDWLGGSLLGVGLAAVGTGAAVFGVGRARVGEANDAASYGAFERLAPSGESGELQQRVGVGVLVTGVALVAAGVVRYLIVHRSRSPAKLRAER